MDHTTLVRSLNFVMVLLSTCSSRYMKSDDWLIDCLSIYQLSSLIIKQLLLINRLATL